MLKLYVRAQLVFEGWLDGLGREEGAVSIEYVGLTSIVAIIIGVLLAKAGVFGEGLASGIDKAIQAVGGGG